MAIEHIEYETVYTAAMEREYVRSQQRAPEVRVVADHADGRVSRVLSAVRLVPSRWWSARDVAQALAMPEDGASDTLNYLARRGDMERQLPAYSVSGPAHPGRPVQRYRLVTK